MHQVCVILTIVIIVNLYFFNIHSGSASFGFCVLCCEVSKQFLHVKLRSMGTIIKSK